MWNFLYDLIGFQSALPRSRLKPAGVLLKLTAVGCTSFFADDDKTDDDESTPAPMVRSTKNTAFFILINYCI